MENKRLSSFEDHLNIVQNVKSASDDSQASSNLLDKLAQELGIEDSSGSVAAPAAPSAEGEVQPAASSVAGAAPSVVAATEAVATPQTTLVGGNPIEAAAGEVPAAVKSNEGVAISAGDGQVTDANNLGRTPDAVAAAARDAGGDEGGQPMPSYDGMEEKTAEESVKIGRLIAKTFKETLEKDAVDAEYTNALNYLNENGILDGYDIKDSGINKQASEMPVDCLEKIANKQPLSREEIIGAAYECIDFEKSAAAAEEQGREDAREFVLDYINKQAQEEGTEEQTPENKEETEKVAALLKDEAVVNAVKVLKEKGILS